MSDLNYDKLKKNDIVHYIRIIKNMDLCEVLELKIVNVYKDYCTATEVKSKQTFLLNKNHAEEFLYQDRKKALHVVKDLQKKGKKKD